jgi:ATP-binding cassette subfamily C exporter for protease/lipase
VLDEPNSNLDETGELALIAAINDLRNRGKTIVMITHRESTLGTTTRLLVLRDGVAQLFGPSDQVKRELIRMSQQLPKRVEDAKQASA